MTAGPVPPPNQRAASRAARPSAVWTPASAAPRVSSRRSLAWPTTASGTASHRSPAPNAASAPLRVCRAVRWTGAAIALLVVGVRPEDALGRVGRRLDRADGLHHGQLVVDRGRRELPPLSDGG